jgi:prolyl oligopeptidase
MGAENGQPMTTSGTLSPTRLISGLLAVVATAGPSAPPAAQVVPYSQTFYGTSRSDPYHWMEAGGPQLATFIDRQSAYTRALLSTNPGRPSVVHALRDAYDASAKATTTSGVVRIGTKLFYLQSLPGSSEPSLQVVVDGGAPHVVIDAKTLPKDHVISWFEPSPRGTAIAYGVTASSENVAIRVCDADGSHDRPQAIDPSVIPDVTWHDERTFYYSSTIESATNRTESSFLHTLDGPHGTDAPIADFGVDGPMGSKSRDLFTSYAVLGRDAVVAMPQHDVTPHKPVFVAPYARAMRASGPWRRLFAERDLVVQVAFAGRYAFALSDLGDPRRTIIVRDRYTGALVRTIPPADGGFRTDIFGNRTGIYVAERVGAGDRLEHFDRFGNLLGPVALPRANTIFPLSGRADSDTFAVETGSWRDPGHWYEIVGSHAHVRDLAINSTIPPLYRRIRYRDGLATSADGTRVPYTVVYAAGTPKDGRRPTLLVGYGAYGFDIEPPMPAYVAALLELGAVVDLAHVRGGGEFGEPWHLAGKGPTKQHTIDDFVACARAVVSDGWTSPAKLAGEGGSAGGITIGGAITQHPELFGVAVSEVGFNDMVDYENMPNGPVNVPEFGSVRTAAGFRNLLAMSAYDHVVPAAYPATILTTGLADQRNAPWQVAKMTARLQAATTSGKPVLLRADTQGHGMVLDASAQVEEYADVWTFVLWQLGEPAFTPPSNGTVTQ